MLKNQYVLVKSYSDGSGVIQAFGTFDSQPRAEHEKDAIVSLADSNSEFKWEIIPIYDFGG